MTPGCDAWPRPLGRNRQVSPAEGLHSKDVLRSLAHLMPHQLNVLELSRNVMSTWTRAWPLPPT